MTQRGPAGRRLYANRGEDVCVFLLRMVFIRPRPVQQACPEPEVFCLSLGGSLQTSAPRRLLFPSPPGTVDHLKAEPPSRAP